MFDVIEVLLHAQSKCCEKWGRTRVQASAGEGVEFGRESLDLCQDKESKWYLSLRVLINVFLNSILCLSRMWFEVFTLECVR